MKKVIERMNNSVIEEQLTQRGKHSSSSTGKDTPKKEKKWPFSWKSSGSVKDAQLQAGAEEEEVEGMRVDFYLVVFFKFIASITVLTLPLSHICDVTLSIYGNLGTLP